MKEEAELSRVSVKEILGDNKYCVDCGAESPDWVSINLGIVVCIACSGIHRSLGTHVSKVRSITLDRLPSAQLGVISRVGNDASNRIWESNLKIKKPGSSAGREALEKFIRRKYVE